MTFDPYQEWLAIEAAKRPIDYYQLLGITHDKSDYAAIAAAVKMRRSQLHPHITGIHEDVARRLIAEVVTAGKCLSDPNLRSTYDAKLDAMRKGADSVVPLQVATPLPEPDGAGQKATPAPEPAGAADSAAVVPVQPGAEISVVVPVETVAEHPTVVPAGAVQPRADAGRVTPHVSSTSRARNHRRRKKSPALAIGMLAAAGLLVVVFALVMTYNPRGSSERLVGDVDSEANPEWETEAPTSPPDESDPHLRDDTEEPRPARGTSTHAPTTNGESSGGGSGTGREAPTGSSEQGDGGEASSRQPSSGGAPRAGLGGRFNKPGGRFIGTGGTWSDDYDPVSFLPESERRRTSSARSTPPESGGATGGTTPDSSGGATTAPVPAAPIEKVKVPGTSARAAAEKTIREVFQIDKSRSPEEMVALLEEMYATAHNTRDDPAAEFVLLEMTRDLAADQGYLGPALNVVGEIVGRFDIDAVQMATQVVLNAKVASDDRDANAIHTVAAVRLAEIASTMDDFDLARNLALAAGTAARRNGAESLQERAKSALRSVRDCERAYEAARPAFDILAARPDDAQANSVSGRYQCFVKEDWQTGLAQLAIGDHQQLAALANMEADAADDIDSQIALADGWYGLAADPSAYAEFADERSRAAILAHAAEWYESALASTAGLQKLKIERRLEEIAKQSGNDGAGEGASPEVGTRNIWFMQDVSAAAMPARTQVAGLPRQQTSDPRGPFRGQGVNFRSTQGPCTVVYEIEWSPRPRTIVFRGAQLRNFRIEILDKQTKKVLASQRSSLSGGSISRPLGIKIPAAAGNRFYLRLQNDSSLYVASLEVQE